MAKQMVTIDGVEYKSRTEAGKALVAGGMGLKEAAAKVGTTYQTIYANTIGAEKVRIRRAHYRILSLGQRGRKTAGEIAKKVGMSTSRVVALLKKNGIAVVTLEARDATKAAKKAKSCKKTEPATDTANVPAASEVPATDTPAANEATVADAVAETTASA